MLFLNQELGTLSILLRVDYTQHDWLASKTAGGKGKRERPLGENWEKREKGKGRDHDLSEFPPYNQSARTHARTETEIDFPVGLTPPNLRYC